MQKQHYHSFTLAGFIITFVGAVLFSTKAIIVKLAFAHTRVDAITLLTLRMLFSFPFYVAVAISAARRKDRKPITRRQWWFIGILGLFGYYLSSLFDFVGLQYISAGLERLILFLYPTFAVLINAVAFRQKINRAQVIALSITYAGIAIAYFGEMQLEVQHPHFVAGTLLIFLCAVTYAFYIAGSGYVIPRVGPTRFTAWAMLASTAGVFIHFAIAGNYTALQQSTHLWGYGILLAIVATVIPTFMISAGLKRIGANNVAIISGIGPVATILQAHFILGEEIFTEQIIGTFLVIAGVLLIGWQSQKKPEKN